VRHVFYSRSSFTRISVIIIIIMIIIIVIIIIIIIIIIIKTFIKESAY